MSFRVVGIGRHVNSVIGLGGRATDRRLRRHHTVLLGGHQNASGSSRHGAASMMVPIAMWLSRAPFLASTAWAAVGHYLPKRFEPEEAEILPP